MRVVIALLALLLAALGAVYFLFFFFFGRTTTTVVTPSEPVKPHPTPVVSSVFAYVPEWVDGEMVLRPEKLRVAAGEAPLETAVKGLLSGDDSIFGHAVTLVGAREEGNTAVLDFGPELRPGYGTDEEEMILKAICTTAGQFKRIEKVRILREGKPVETFGSVSLTEPLPVIRP